MRFFLLFILSFPVIAGVPVDVVFDIDLTIVAAVNDGPGGDLLADPKDPLKGTVGITFESEGALHKERYRIFEGVQDLVDKLRKDPRVRISFFSGGPEPRNEALLKSIKLQGGISLWDAAQGRVYGRASLTPTGLGPEARIRERFKKDLTRINPDLSDVILIDDIKEFVPESQAKNLLWIGEEFPFPGRVDDLPLSVDPGVLAREKHKYERISAQLEEALTKRFSSGRPLSAIIHETSVRTFLPGGLTCDPRRVLDRLLAE